VAIDWRVYQIKRGGSFTMPFVVKYLRKLDDLIEQIFVILGAAFLAIVLVSCALQVFTRYVLNNSLAWTEELSRYSVIWSTLMGSVLATKSGAHCAVAVLDGFFKGKAKVVKDVFVLGCVLAVGLIMVIQGGIFVLSANTQSISLRIPMSLVYLAVPVSGFGVMVTIVIKISDIFMPSPIVRPDKEVRQ
jgi:TRAP-type C4-dicarboxylate transport system permease small subunit